jgi:hypothetical protein
MEKNKEIILLLYEIFSEFSPQPINFNSIIHFLILPPPLLSFSWGQANLHQQVLGRYRPFTQKWYKGRP